MSADWQNQVVKINAERAAKSAYWGTTVLYKTFIPEATIAGPPASCDYNAPYRYGGDNRGYSATGGSARTTMGVTVNWKGSTPKLMPPALIVDPTKLYSSKKKYISSKTASAKDMSIKVLGQTKTSIDLRFNLKAGNPYCTGLIKNSIQGAFTMTVTRNGAYAVISGSHRQMPNHEIYVRGFDGGAWKTVYRRTYYHATCLASWTCPQVGIVGSGSY